MSPPLPCVLVFSGLDPTGGAGLQADQEALAAMGCHPCPIATSLTVQDTGNAQAQYPVAPAILQAQCRTLMRDVSVAGVKIGLLPNGAVIEVVAEILRALPDIPVVMDPVLAATGGTELADPDRLRRLLPLVTLLTPNRAEARRLTGRDEVGEQAAELRRLGCGHALLTGGDADAGPVRNHLYSPAGLLETYAWERLPGPFHGSGCTLTAAIGGLLARGQGLREAVAEAQRYTWETLRRAYAIGHGQRIPRRVLPVHD